MNRDEEPTSSEVSLVLTLLWFGNNVSYANEVAGSFDKPRFTDAFVRLLDAAPLQKTSELPETLRGLLATASMEPLERKCLERLLAEKLL